VAVGALSPASRFDALLFDFDGVLADTEKVHYECWSEILQPFGIAVSWEVYLRECVGISDRLMVQRLAAQTTPPGDFELIWAEYPRKQSLFRAHLEASPPFLADTLALIRDAARDHKLAVVSSSGRTEVEPPLVRAGIRDYFQVLVCGKEAVNLKPAPDPYRMAAELLGARVPLVIEDSDAGIASGIAAGFETVRVSSPESVAREVRARISAARGA
jgi:HAD superfamily hydrolase (TIGR01509 family)